MSNENRAKTAPAPLNWYERTLTVVQASPATWVWIDERGERRGKFCRDNAFEKAVALVAAWQAEYAEENS